MTNTLHRYGHADSFRDDYVVFRKYAGDRKAEEQAETDWAKQVLKSAHGRFRGSGSAG